MAKYILFDTETTGTEEHDKVIQVGAIIVDSKGAVEVINDMCLAPVDISLGAMEIHNITPEMLVGKPVYAETKFSQRITELNTTENFLIAHNINFDLSMLLKEGFESNCIPIDTLRASRHLYPDMPHHRLQYMRYALELYKEEGVEADRLGIAIKAHDAIGDVLVMKLLLSKLVNLVRERFPEENAMAKLAELTATPVLIKMFKFGKYKGELIEDVVKKDRGYLNWMRGNMELDEDMAFTLEHHLG